MLRCPPSRISLSTADVHDFENRFDARRRARALLFEQPNVRLSPGPSHQTKHTIISQEHNVGKKRASSLCSQATVCPAGDDTTGDLPMTFISNSSGAWAVDTPTDVRNCHHDQSRLATQAARALEGVLRSRSSPLKPLPELPAEALITEHPTRPLHDQPTSAEHALRFTGATLDGCIDIRPTVSPPRRRQSGSHVALSHRGLPVLGELRGDAYPTSSPPRTEPPVLSSSRARRRNAHSQDTHVYSEDALLQHGIQADQTQSLTFHGRYPDACPSSVPELVSAENEENIEPPINPALEPDAPVFVPRMRSGTITTSSAEGHNPYRLGSQWGSLDTTRTSSNLRLRSSSDQDVDPPLRTRTNTSDQSDPAVQARHRRRSRTSEHNAATQPPTPNLERYPVLRPPPRLIPQRRNSGSQRAAPLPARRYGRSPSTTFHQTTGRVARPDVPEHGVLAPPTTQMGRHGQPWGDSDVQRSAIPSSSRSTSSILQPPLSEPRVQIRTSSLACGHVATTPAHRVPSMVSAASGISSTLSSRRSSAERTLDAAAEFLRMRNSPLDDLTERLSRMAASRPRSVGRSWERQTFGRGRVSLLHGDPFRQDPPPTLPSSPVLPAAEATASPRPREIIRRNDSTQLPGESAQPNLVAVSSPTQLGSSPVQVPSPALPSTPPPQLANLSSPHKPLDQLSPAKPTVTPRAGSAIKRKPVPATSKVVVYNDGRPPHTQPQTPADIHKSARRWRGRSDTVVHARPSSAYPGFATPPPTRTERHPHRNAYPSTSPPQLSDEVLTRNTSLPPVPITAMESARREDVRRRAEAQRNDLAQENDEAGGHIQGLEQERRVWLSRGDLGTLDITPPAEGRFERYLY